MSQDLPPVHLDVTASSSIPLPRNSSNVVCTGFAGLSLGGGTLSLIGLLVNTQQFVFSYLTAWLWLLSLTLGALFWTLMHHLTGASWSVVIRRIFENVIQGMPILVCLSLPVVIGLFDNIPRFYEWANINSVGETIKTGMLPNELSDHDISNIEKKTAYLNTGFFFLRLSSYFIIWLILTKRLTALSFQQDETGNPEISRKMQAMSGPGILLLALTSTFAAFDLIMSLTPTWYSTIFGVYFWAGSIGGSIALCAVIVIIMQRADYLSEVNAEHRHDIGKLLFGFTVFWAYIAFSQYFLQWYANLPEETHFFIRRQNGFWWYLTFCLPVCRFLIPFCLLLSRTTKRSPLILGMVSAWIVIIHYYDLYWQVMPTLHRESPRPHWMDLTTFALMTGILGLTVMNGFRSRPLIPIRDERLEDSLHHEND